ncbi:MAG: aspartate carbamoyltransferase [Candidatus Bipolaricaulota bacterium]|nr:aspartate carbamoyltransferase [Candidatus Bipolaricaulota bacterium]
MEKLTQKDVLRADQFTKQDIDLIMETARGFEKALHKGKILDTLRGKVLATLFYEPSTRTRLSFEAAMHRLGGRVISVAEARSSSAAKGESLHDTIKTVEGYADVIVLRHPQIGAAQEAAAATDRPVLNAGDGAGQHPTQSLLDFYTIEKEQGKVEGLTVALAGDLKHGRTVHSLADLLASYNVDFVFVSPAALHMPAETVDKLKKKGVSVTETEDLSEAIAASDVLYMTRIQRERFEDPSDYDRLKDAYVLTREMLAGASMTIMHPLPRVNEIATDVDTYPGAAYFRQAANGVPIRMALLSLLTEGK